MTGKQLNVRSAAFCHFVFPFSCLNFSGTAKIKKTVDNRMLVLMKDFAGVSRLSTKIDDIEQSLVLSQHSNKLTGV